jgi:subtilisin family serine protease
MLHSGLLTRSLKQTLAVLAIGLSMLSFNVCATKVSVIDIDFGLKDIIDMSTGTFQQHSDYATLAPSQKHGDLMAITISNTSHHASVDKYKINNEEDLIATINKATSPQNPSPTKILNISLESKDGCSPALQDTISLAKSNGAIIIIAAGNTPYPYLKGIARCNDAVIVGASDPKTNAVADFSNYSINIDVFASEYGNSNTHKLGRGTSFSAAMIAGIAAEVTEANPNMDVDSFKQFLNSHSDKDKIMATTLELSTINYPNKHN